MPKKPGCFGHFTENFGNPNCDNCWCRTDCYEQWNKKDKEHKQQQEEAQKQWWQKKPLTELLPEACEKCER